MRYKVTTHDSTYTINARTFTVKCDMVIFFGGSNITEVAGFPSHAIRSIISDEA